MQYKTHLATSMAISIPIMAVTDTFSAMNLIALGVGTLLPDIDEPQSYIGRRTRGISDVIKLIFGHRGITHTIFATIFIGMVVFFISLKLNIPLSIPLYFAIGYLMHLIGDGFSKQKGYEIDTISFSMLKAKIVYNRGFSSFVIYTSR